jgi:hypothetical protein
MAVRSRKAYDLVFVLDGTQSTENVFSALKDEIVDRATEIHLLHREIVGHYGVVVYRDPVDNPGDPRDRNEFFQLTHDFEAVQDYLARVESYGGRDNPEDWVGGLRLALDEMHWRDGKKCIFWIADDNAHGSRFSLERRDRHDDQAALLPPMIERAAREHIYFVLVNVQVLGDPGCAKTAAQLRDIYQRAGGPSFTIVDFKCEWNVDKWTGAGWAPEAVNAFHETIRGTLSRERVAHMGL